MSTVLWALLCFSTVMEWDLLCWMLGCLQQDSGACSQAQLPAQVLSSGSGQSQKPCLDSKDSKTLYLLPFPLNSALFLFILLLLWLNMVICLEGFYTKPCDKAYPLDCLNRNLREEKNESIKKVQRRGREAGRQTRSRILISVSF